jgi:hypothetical protein
MIVGTSPLAVRLRLSVRQAAVVEDRPADPGIDGSEVGVI